MPKPPWWLVLAPFFTVLARIALVVVKHYFK